MTWKNCYQLYLQAFRTPKSTADKKKLARLLKKPLDPEIEKDLFDYDAFLRGLGRMSLSEFLSEFFGSYLSDLCTPTDLEAHGGLYILHSHINHSCTPNVSIRHLDTRTALSRITVIASKAIPAGEELVITYVNPEASVKERRNGLLEWGFGECRCKRCMEEAKRLKSNGVETTAVGVDDDLERELKAGLGVM